jgi:hypothetical protein
LRDCVKGEDWQKEGGQKKERGGEVEEMGAVFLQRLRLVRFARGIGR